MRDRLLNAAVASAKNVAEAASDKADAAKNMTEHLAKSVGRTQMGVLQALSLTGSSAVIPSEHDIPKKTLDFTASDPNKNQFGGQRVSGVLRVEAAVKERTRSPTGSGTRW